MKVGYLLRQACKLVVLALLRITAIIRCSDWLAVKMTFLLKAIIKSARAKAISSKPHCGSSKHFSLCTVSIAGSNILRLKKLLNSLNKLLLPRVFESQKPAYFSKRQLFSHKLLDRRLDATNILYASS